MSLHSSLVRVLLLSGAILFTASGCADKAKVPAALGYGPNPILPAPNPEKIPTVKVADAKGWSGSDAPTPAAGFAVTALARGLDHPRWLYTLPNGDILVAETNAPPRPKEEKSLKGKMMGMMMKKAGAATPSANRITLLRDADGDGTAETRTVFLQGLNSPFGMARVGDSLFVANTDAVVRFPY